MFLYLLFIFHHKNLITIRLLLLWMSNTTKLEFSLLFMMIFQTAWIMENSISQPFSMTTLSQTAVLVQQNHQVIVLNLLIITSWSMQFQSFRTYTCLPMCLHHLQLRRENKWNTLQWILKYLKQRTWSIIASCMRVNQTWALLFIEAFCTRRSCRKCSLLVVCSVR